MLARIQRSMKEKDEGFTLIELLVVIIIIGILAAIAIPVFLNQRKKAVDAGIKSDLRSVANEMESAYTDAQVYPTGGTGVGATPIPTVKKSPNNIVTIKVSNGTSGNDGFCVQGHNPKATATGTGAKAFYYYDSQTGGLVPEPQAGPPTTGACASAGNFVPVP